MGYLSPGVYVEEVASSSKPIAGVGTSTAGFIGRFDDPVVDQVSGESLTAPDATTKEFPLKYYPVATDAGTHKVTVAAIEQTDATLRNDDAKKVSLVVLKTAPSAGSEVKVDYKPLPTLSAKSGEVRLCTNFTEFTAGFGGFSTLPERQVLAHAVYGFFNNGGTRCYVVRQAKAETGYDAVLAKLAAVDEIAIVAAPGLLDARDALVRHCALDTGDRFAILDTALAAGATGIDESALNLPGNSAYAATYFPDLRVFDPATKAADPSGDGVITVPPSGHMAGIFARVDTTRGVHKAPANEVVYGAVDLDHRVSRAVQDGLNPGGVNCIRSLNGNITVWGARTLGGDANGEFKYVNVRRLFLYLRKSIDQGTQWCVFEPNNQALWEKVKRNLTAFLTNVWRDGALFGATPQEAFYVKCDAETNPPDLRALGQLVTEIGVAVVEPAEFVVFRISQWAGPGK